MDLTRLYNLTTPELREEAERLGVGDTYAMSRGQLIHAIRNQVGGPPPEGLFGKVLGFAKWALQPPRKGEPSSSPGTPDDEWEAKRLSRPSDVPMPSIAPPSTVAEAEVGTVAGTERGAEAGAGSVPASAPVPEPASVTEPLSVTESGTESESATVSGPPSRPPAGVFSKSAGMYDEPFPTRTMARILAEQGHFKRSLAIYAGLLRNQPGDPELSAEVGEVRARSRARRSQVH